MTVTDSDAVDDRAWFAENPQRRYRLRRTSGDLIAIRRSRGFMLRTRIATISQCTPDTDRALRVLWVAAAWPDLNAQEQAALIKLMQREEEAQ
jgi:hypothetical protein